MNIILFGFLALIALGLVVGLASVLTRKGNDDDVVVPASGDCYSCNGDDPTCEQVCMMEAATKPIEYYDDEELDRFIGRASEDYTSEEAEEFMDVMQTMHPDEVKDWNRSLILRGINVPNQIKDDLIAMIQD